MALDPAILRKIRYEVGPEEFGADVDDDAALETIFNDEDEGNSAVLPTALIVWRARLSALSARSFDVSTEGSLLSRSQRIRYIERRIKELEEVADDTIRAQNVTVKSAAQVHGDADSTGAEFS